jgi:hypothetical protein
MKDILTLKQFAEQYKLPRNGISKLYHADEECRVDGLTRPLPVSKMGSMYMLTSVEAHDWFVENLSILDRYVGRKNYPLTYRDKKKLAKYQNNKSLAPTLTERVIQLERDVTKLIEQVMFS